MVFKRLKAFFYRLYAWLFTRRYRVYLIRTGESLPPPLTPEEERIPDDLLRRSMHCGKDYRTRYTLFKLIDECGLLEEYLADYPYPFQ